MVLCPKYFIINHSAREVFAAKIRINPMAFQIFAWYKASKEIGLKQNSLKL